MGYFLARSARHLFSLTQVRINYRREGERGRKEEGEREEGDGERGRKERERGRKEMGRGKEEEGREAGRAKNVTR